MIGAVLGNGPSKQFFDGIAEYVIGCNIPGEDYEVDATVICDEEMVWVLKNNLTAVTVPVIISTRVYEKIKELKMEDRFEILHVFKPKEWYNSAHYAAEYLMEHGCDTLYVWGCDSIFKDDISSSTDSYVKKEGSNADKLIRNWRNVWLKIQQQNPDVNIRAIRIEE